MNFFRRFPNEQSCIDDFKNWRDRQGVICKKCSFTKHFWLKGKQQYQCKSCGFRTTLRSGTILQASNLPFQYWYITIHLMTNTKKAFSAKELQRQLGHKRYEPIWAMMHKIRKAMGKLDRMPLTNEVEMDDSLVIVNPKAKSNKEYKPGRGSERRAPILVWVDRGLEVPQVRMSVVERMTTDIVMNQCKEKLSSNVKLTTDAFSAFRYLHKLFEVKTINGHGRWKKKDMPWVHLMISNLKRLLNGIYHCVSTKYLQNYLDEFCFKTNRRRLGPLKFNLAMESMVTSP